ncbi:hypothetical protein HFN89_01385 [Rhizobium laguerreae]|nr:hypothetical protein [Rhizobium laguerreae]
MENLATLLRQRVSEMGTAVGCLGEHGSRDYLHWMIDTVAAEVQWPRDKRVRWLGYVAGARDFATWGKDSASVSRMRDFNMPILSALQGKHEAILFAGLEEVLEGLEDIAERAGSATANLAYFARRSSTAAKASFSLGYTQAYMTGNRLIDVNGERDRTRAIFHRVYAQCGFEVPKSRDRSTEIRTSESA